MEADTVNLSEGEKVRREADVPVPPTEGEQKWRSWFERGTSKQYPAESLVRIFRGALVDVPREGRVLDVGFGSEAELIMFAQSGFEAHGLEITPIALEQARAKAREAGVSLALDLIRGTGLQFPDDHFDVVISWNAVYYHGSRTLVEEAIREFHRVLRPGGALLLSVIHPSSWMVRRLSDPLEDGVHVIERPSERDTRAGLRIFYEPTSSGWRRLLAPFADIEEGCAESDLFAPAHREGRRLFLARKRDVPP